MATATAMDEVAQLLVSVYDDYVSWADSGSTILQGLLRLLHDLTLSAAVSILDAERLRLRVMKGAMGSRHVAMTCEQFYEWLREGAGGGGADAGADACGGPGIADCAIRGRERC